MRTILFLAANPNGTPRLHLDREVKEIEGGLVRSEKRDQFKLVQKWAVSADDLRRALLDHKPEIVHFSGHGNGANGLAFEHDGGKTHEIRGVALGSLFELFSDTVDCVVLNACYSEHQADDIARHIDYVIGMNEKIDDEAAIKFAVGFYDGLGAGMNYEAAFKLGRNAIDLGGMPDHLIPVLKAVNKMAFFTINPNYGRDEWNRFNSRASMLGLCVHEGNDIDRVMWGVGRKLNLTRGEINSGVWHSDTRIVLIVDIFEGNPSGEGGKQHHRNSPKQYVDFIFKWRDLTKGRDNEIIFVLYDKSTAFSTCDHGLDEETVRRLNGYFMIYSDLESETSFVERMKTIKTSVKKELHLHKP